MTAPATHWPIGVFARYRTVGGETVDLTRTDGAAIRVDCVACPYGETVDHYSETTDEPAAQNERVARARAESHADRCRAVAPPGQVHGR